MSPIWRWKDAVEKLSALCWRMGNENQPDRRDRVRHLHDLACLANTLQLDKQCADLLFETVEADLEGRADISREQALDRLRLRPSTLAPYGTHYAQYVSQTSCASSASAPPTFFGLEEMLAGLQVDRPHTAYSLNLCLDAGL